MSDTEMLDQQQTPLVALMDQVPSGEIQAQSPLHHADLESLAKANSGSAGVTLKENKLLGHLVLRCDASNAQQTAAVKKALGFELPIQPLTSTHKGDYVMRWMTPDEWLITMPGLASFDVEEKLRQEMVGHYSLVNSSGGNTVIELSGPHAVDVLKKSTPIDFYPTEFPVGKVVSTIFAKSSATIRRISDERFELVIRRSFADYIWLWLQDASLEFGLNIEI
ncbi:sarcosine oxidase subunit gamma family protein [Vibrio sp. AK197]